MATLASPQPSSSEDAYTLCEGSTPVKEKEEERAVCDLSDALAGPNVMTKQKAEIAVRGKVRCSFSRNGQIRQT